LRALPEGSLGRAYLAFMEGEKLTPEGLLASAERGGYDFHHETEYPEFRRLTLHASLSHDLWHVLTGYGRDPLGELLNVVFTWTQTRNPGLRLLVAIGLLAQKLKQPALPIFKAAREAARMGGRVDFILQNDVEALLPLPLEDVRRRLNFTAPTIYNSIPNDKRRASLRLRIRRGPAPKKAGGKPV
jgi:ubiquinone biosynthesis protein COQ4